LIIIHRFSIVKAAMNAPRICKLRNAVNKKPQFLHFSIAKGEIRPLITCQLRRDRTCATEYQAVGALAQKHFSRFSRYTEQYSLCYSYLSGLSAGSQCACTERTCLQWLLFSKEKHQAEFTVVLEGENSMSNTALLSEVHERPSHAFGLRRYLEHSVNMRLNDLFSFGAFLESY
jgi:hypothetical protein